MPTQKGGGVTHFELVLSTKKGGFITPKKSMGGLKHWEGRGGFFARLRYRGRRYPSVIVKFKELASGQGIHKSEDRNLRCLQF